MEVRRLCSNGGPQSLPKPIPILQPLRHVLDLIHDSIVARLTSECCADASMLSVPVRTLPSRSRGSRQDDCDNAALGVQSREIHLPFRM